MDQVDIRFNGTEGNQTRNGAVPVRTRIGREGGASVRRRNGSVAVGEAVRDVQNGGSAN